MSNNVRKVSDSYRTKLYLYKYIYIVHCEQHKDTNIYKVCRVQKNLEDLMDIQNSEMFYIFM